MQLDGGFWKVRLDRRVDEVFLARFWKKDAVVMWVDWMGAGWPLDGYQHVMLQDGSFDSPQRPKKYRFIAMVERWIGCQRTTCIGSGGSYSYLKAFSGGIFDIR